MKYCIAFCLLLCVTTLPAQNKDGRIKVTDMLKIRQLGSVSISPDGSQIVLVVNQVTPMPDKKWEYRYFNQLYLVPSDGHAEPRPLSFRENASQPAWSPDGKQLVFVRETEGKPQLFLLSLDGGEPRQLTHFRYGAAAPKWSPDGRSLLFAASIPLTSLLTDSLLNPRKQVPSWPLEKPGFPKNEQLNPVQVSPDPDGNTAQIRAYLENNEADKKAKVMDKLNFQEESATSGAISFTHFFIADVQTGNQIREVTHGFYRYFSADFTPDGHHLILTANCDSLHHPDRCLETMVYQTDLYGDEMIPLLQAPGKTFQGVRLSPSGRWLAFLSGTTDFVQVPSICLLPLQAPLKDTIHIDFDRSVGAMSWTADEKYIYFTASSNGGVPLYRLNIRERKVEKLTGDDEGIVSADLNGNLLAFVKTSVANPFELYVADANAAHTQRITSFNASWLEGKFLSFPEKHQFTNEQGMPVEYWVMKPWHYEKGTKYPAILEIHGGPTAMWGPGETSMWHEYQYYCARGYVVVYCNPRGSGGYGAGFLRANINDWGKGPASDVLTALDKATQEGFIDTSRLLVTGGSYAGYLVAWIIGHDQRFKAACSQRGVYDLRTFFGEGNAWRLVPNYFGGYPWQPEIKAVLERESPITYVNNIHTPYIMFHGETDLRTGVIGGEMMYKSLKVLGRTVEYVQHPGATHEITRSGDNRQRIDQMLRTVEFFERFVKRNPGY
ncbi:MAG TPA: S9 family peptidase [Sediminibacterium sp.]|nr:S9 family peptidase [Sediminibacterium sp.]